MATPSRNRWLGSPGSRASTPYTTAPQRPADSTTSSPESQLLRLPLRAHDLPRQPPRVDHGDAFRTKGILSVVPPKPGPPYPTLVPAVDEDGNAIGGIRLPELQAPLGTYQGWNPRRPEFGAPEYLLRFDGSFRALPLTESERERNGDPRRSVEARYPTKDDYVARVRSAVRRLLAEGFLPPEDARRYEEQARRMAWPPKPLDGAPYWLLELDWPRRSRPQPGTSGRERGRTSAEGSGLVR